MDGRGPEAARRIARLKRERDALILAHNYQRPEVQDVADYTGDSLELSRIAAKAGESVIVFCGVRFMAETAAILCPGKTVLLPVREAGCALADAASPDQVRKVRIRHPDAVVVSYVNTSAEVKAESDLCCTSANAVAVLRSVERKRPILFVSDRHLGHYAARMTGRKVILWDGSCPTHAALCVADIVQARDRYPHAKVMAHPECQSDVLKIADRVTGTAGMLAYAAQQASGTAFIVGTDIGLIHRLRKENPDKTFYPVTDYLICPTMKLTTLGDVIRSLETMTTKVKVADRTRLKARVALDAMLSVG
jgi:quinolinate synthase